MNVCIPFDVDKEQRMASRNPRSPIKDNPLRTAGQSLEEERTSIWDDKLEPPAVMAVCFVAIAFLEWWRVWTNAPPAPMLFSLVAFAMVGFAAWRVRRYLPRLRDIRQGIDGERAVGQYLEGLRANGYHVFHDVVGPTFNVDHVIVGPAGIFTIETKTWSKPIHGEAHVKADSEGLLVAGQRPDRDPIVQARAQASWIHRQINESTGKPFAVKPVIVFPGWFIESSAQQISNLWVLEPKALPSFLERETACLDVSDVRLAAYHLSRMIRSAQHG